MRKNVLIRSVAGVAGLAMMVTLAACGNNSTSTNTNSSGSSPSATISGSFQGAGSTAQQVAITGAWIPGFQATNPSAKIAYNGVGSGAGVSTFLTGATAWAGSDSPLTSAQVQKSSSVCASGTAFDVPVYISPIAIVFNLQGISGKGKHLNMDASTIAKIFDGKITKWDDPALKALNPSVSLPSTAITIIHRSDKSGTTENFVSYLKDAAPADWPHAVSQVWPNSLGQGGTGTSGVVNAVGQADGTIAYADASKAGNLGTAAIKVGSSFVPYSANAAAKVAESSPLDPTATQPNRVVVKINHTTTAAGEYPLILISYSIVCPAYKDVNNAKFVKAWVNYEVSTQGQQKAADVSGSAPMSSTLRAKVITSLGAIKTS